MYVFQTRLLNLRTIVKPNDEGRERYHFVRNMIARLNVDLSLIGQLSLSPTVKYVREVPDKLTKVLVPRSTGNNTIFESRRA